MAHRIYEKEMKEECPRCGKQEVRIATYYFESTYTAECSHCGFGHVDGCNEDMAIARYRGKIFERSKK